MWKETCLILILIFQLLPSKIGKKSVVKCEIEMKPAPRHLSWILDTDLNSMLCWPNMDYFCIDTRIASSASFVIKLMCKIWKKNRKLPLAHDDHNIRLIHWICPTWHLGFFVMENLLIYLWILGRWADIANQFWKTVLIRIEQCAQ